MKDPVWNKFLTEKDREVLGDSGWGARGGFGERPVIIVIDVTNDFTGDRDEPVIDSIKRGKFMSCGEYAYKALPRIKELLDVGRSKGLPVIYTASVHFRADRWDVGGWAWKNSKIGEPISESELRANTGNDIHEMITPKPQDIFIRKTMPSAFHDTPLKQILTLFRADSVIMVGTTTSGCVRASAVDGFCSQYRVTLVEEGCFDRFESSHAMSLFDVGSKYADIVPQVEVLDYINGLPDNLFELPQGGLATTN